MTRSGFARIGVLSGAVAAAVATMIVAPKADAEVYPLALTPRNIVCGTAGCYSGSGTILCATGKLTLTIELATISYEIPCYFQDSGQDRRPEDEM
jgi:hypothetical protein